MENAYKTINEISYNENTPNAVIRILNNAMTTKNVLEFFTETRKRVKIG